MLKTRYHGCFLSLSLCFVFVCSLSVLVSGFGLLEIWETWRVSNLVKGIWRTLQFPGKGHIKVLLLLRPGERVTGTLFFVKRGPWGLCSFWNLYVYVFICGLELTIF